METKEIMSKTIRCCRTTLLLVAAIFVLGTATAMAQHTTGFNMAKTCPTTVLSGASFNCSVTIANRDVDHGVINLALTNQVPFPGGPTTALTCFQPFDATECDTTGPTGTAVNSLGVAGSLTASCGACIPETAPINCTANNISYVDEVRATGTDAAASPSPFFNLPVSSATTNATPVAPLVCDDNSACTTDTCDPTATTVQAACVFTPITCDDNDACTTDTCDPATGCVATPITCDDNDACTTDTCDPATGCVATPITCDDNDACTTDTCDPATGCVATPISCDDNDACTTETCDPATGCTTPTPVTCDDNDICTDDACDPATGQCVFTPDPTNDPSCDNDEICRTPGFWGTHGGVEKGGPNVTGTVLNLYGGNLLICGEPVTTVDLGDQSAIQAICVSPKGNSNLQLARQLTAAALNCIVSNSTSCEGAGQNATNVCGGTSIEDLFAECNAVCADSSSTQSEIGDCIGAIDCFNNGGASYDAATDICSGDSGCHDRSLGCIGFQNTGPASSPRKCNDARKDPETIF